MNNLKVLNEIEPIVEKLYLVTEDSLNILAPMVEDIILFNSKDEKHIEIILDRLLDLCFNDEALLLYKRLCRYYLEINPEAVKEYTKYYFEIYEEDSKVE